MKALAVTIPLRRARRIIAPMPTRLKSRRSPAEVARDTAAIIGNLRHEGYEPNAADEAIHARVARGELTTEQAIAAFRDRGLAAEAAAEKRPKKRAS
jgi:hypothetical protein